MPCSLTARDDLLTGTVADTLSELAGQEDQQAVAAQRATALLDLARTGDAEPVLEALAEPGRFPGLLHELATRPTPQRGARRVVAYTAATSPAEAATAVFYLAVAAAAGGDLEQAGDLIRQARAAIPRKSPTGSTSSPRSASTITASCSSSRTHLPRRSTRTTRTPARGHPMTAPTDLVVVLPGILGSTLRRDGRLVWAPSAGSRCAHRHVRRLAPAARAPRGNRRRAP